MRSTSASPTARVPSRQARAVRPGAGVKCQSNPAPTVAAITNPDPRNTRRCNTYLHSSDADVAAWPGVAANISPTWPPGSVNPSSATCTVRPSQSLRISASSPGTGSAGTRPRSHQYTLAWSYRRSSPCRPAAAVLTLRARAACERPAASISAASSWLVAGRPRTGPRLRLSQAGWSAWSFLTVTARTRPRLRHRMRATPRNAAIGIARSARARISPAPAAWVVLSVTARARA